jgi:hypothetical protein
MPSNPQSAKPQDSLSPSKQAQTTEQGKNPKKQDNSPEKEKFKPAQQPDKACATSGGASEVKSKSGSAC